MRDKIPSGNYYFDLWLDGGYEKDVITTFYGPAASGKTNFCLMATAKQAALNKKVIFIDTEGGFSVKRLNQINKNALDKVLLFNVTNFKEQIEVFNKILSMISKKIGLIVVDGIAMQYRLALSEAARNKEKVRLINSSLVRQLRILSEIARKKHIPALVTDQVYSEFLTQEEIENGKKPSISLVAGNILKYWSKCIIELQIEGKKRKAILRKHRSLPEKEFSFMIVEKGIKKVS